MRDDRPTTAGRKAEKTARDWPHSQDKHAATQRVVIENLEPQVDCGTWPVKRCLGEFVDVEADVYTDGHDAIGCVLLYRAEGDSDWVEVPMKPLVNDRWRATFTVTSLGVYRFTVVGWVDHFQTWRRDLSKKAKVGQVAVVDLMVGATLLAEAAESGRNGDARASRRLEEFQRLVAKAANQDERAVADAIVAADDHELGEFMWRLGPRKNITRFERELTVEVDRPRAGFGAWYEVFPRSCGEKGTHGTFRDLEARLPYIASMGFDVLYLPPIHPIGRTKRKGRNNATAAEPEDVGSPWAIGAAEGGHKAIHPALGTMDDFQHLLAEATSHGLEIALDIAFQCSPDHPYLKERPEWFRKRPDGTMQYAENPPKKYEDIYPFDFETPHWRELWDELLSIFLFWIDSGVRIFRVDNPHTKPFSFWQWCIAQVKAQHPDVIVLSEAFTRPKVMKRLAKVGFSQSYTYFAWKNTTAELREYFTELTTSPMPEFYRANVWPNTPDILNEYLQFGGRPAFMARLVLAATLAANYGIYGPAFELCEHQPREPGSEEYLDSEKYQLRDWALDDPASLREFIALVNRIRRENEALQSDRRLTFHKTDNDQLISYSKSTVDLANIIVTVVNVDPHHSHSGWVELPLDRWDMQEDAVYQVHDLLSGAHYIWRGRWNYVELNPHVSPAHIFLLKRHVRTAKQFEYFE